MRVLPVLAAVVAFTAAISLALMFVPSMPQTQPALRRPAVPRSPPLSPIGRLETAISERRWDLANQLALLAEVADSPRIVQWRDQIRRGVQRDMSGVIESKVLVGALAAWGPADTQRISLKSLTADAPYTLPEKRLRDLLVFAPRKLDTEMIEALVDELRLMHIEGLELNAAGRPLPELAGLQLRYAGGTAIDRLPPAVFAACGQPEILDLTGRKEGVAEILAAVAGRPSLRILRLPATQPLGPGGLHALAGLSGLEELSVSATGLTADGVTLLASTQLRQLRLENQLPVEAFAGLGRLADLRRLTCTLASGVDFAPLAALPDLEELTLAVATAGGPSPDWLRFVQVKVLRLSQPGIDDRYADAIQRMPLLDRLELNSTAITDAGLLLLAGNPRLRVIDLGVNPGITGAILPRLLRQSALRELRLASVSIPEAAVLGCPGPGQLERFTWGGASPSKELLEHLIAWPGMARVAVQGKLDAEMKKRIDDANERRAQVPPDLPSAPAIGF